MISLIPEFRIAQVEDMISNFDNTGVSMDPELMLMEIKNVVS